MDIVFEKGSNERPKGHALLYFRSTSGPEEIWATYLVVLPVAVDVSKYVPPFLMNQMGDIGPKDLSAFAFPPAPEEVWDYTYLQNLASARDDDLLFGGTIDPADVASALMRVNEAVQHYADIYSQRVDTYQPADPSLDEGPPGLGVSEVLYGLMSDSDKLSELTKLVGKLRFGMEGGENALVREAEADINFLAKHLPENHQIHRLIESARFDDSRNARLTDLYLQRCFHLIQEEYVKLGKVEEEIRALVAGDPSA